MISRTVPKRARLEKIQKCMKPIPINPETERIARRVLWFESPEEALADPLRFMAYAMAGAFPEDMVKLGRYVDEADFLEALEKAPPGIIGRRSWDCWNLQMGRCPVPPMPKREFR